MKQYLEAALRDQRLKGSISGKRAYLNADVWTQFFNDFGFKTLGFHGLLRRSVERVSQELEGRVGAGPDLLVPCDRALEVARGATTWKDLWRADRKAHRILLVHRNVRPNQMKLVFPQRAARP